MNVSQSSKLVVQNMKFTIVYFFTLFYWKGILGSSSKNNYFDGLIKYLKEDSKLHQVVIIRVHKHTNMDPIMDFFMKEVYTHFPSRSINYDEIDIVEERQTLKDFYYSKSSTKQALYVFHCQNILDNRHLGNIKIRLQLLSKASLVPKCLIINCSSERILKTLRQSEYLDVMLMTYDNEYKQMKLKKISHKLPVLKQINAFTNIIASEIVSPDSQWFPNKLRDMNGYKLNFSCYSLDLFSCKSKRQIILAEIIAKALNITYEIQGQQRNAEFYLDIEQNYGSSFVINSNTRILKLDSVKFVVPRTLKNTKDIIISPEFWYMLIVTICTIAVIRFSAFFMRFERSTWQTLNISQMIMGVTTTQQPRNLQGRIVFGSLLITCLVYSGYIYSVILDITWRSEPEISNLQELADSSLIPMAYEKLKYKLTSSTNPDILKIWRKTVFFDKGDGVDSDCWRYLINYHNVSCLFHDAEAVNDYAAKLSVDVKLLPESIVPYFSSWRSSAHSPFNDCFNKIIRRASEFGLLKDFYQKLDLHPNTSHTSTIEKNTLLLILFCISIIGYSLSIITFLLEIFLKQSAHSLHKEEIFT